MRQHHDDGGETAIQKAEFMKFEFEVCFDFPRRIMRPHQRFADKHGIRPGIEHALGVFERLDAAFGNQQHVIGNFLRELFGRRQIHFEGFQVPVVHADEIRAELQGALHFPEIVHFHEHVEHEALRLII